MGTIDPDGRGRQLAGPQNPQNLSYLTPLERIVLSIYFEDARRERPRNEEAVSQPSCPRVRLFMDARRDSDVCSRADAAGCMLT